MGLTDAVIRKSGGGGGDALAFFWGLAESTVFFLLPDVLLTFTALFSWRAAFRQCLYATGGAVVGGALLFAWAQRDRAAAQGTVEAVPFVRSWMPERAAEDLVREGPRAVVRGPTRGIPYKVYAVVAPLFVSPTGFVLWSIPGRVWRFLLALFVAGGVGVLWRRRGNRRAGPLIAFHGAAWIVIYSLYWTRI